MIKLSIRDIKKHPLAPEPSPITSGNGWMSPEGIFYSIGQLYHSDWMINNYFWLTEVKHITLPTIKELEEMDVDTSRLYLVNAGWVRTSTWGVIVRSVREQEHLIKDYVLALSKNGLNRWEEIQIFETLGSYENTRSSSVKIRDLVEDTLVLASIKKSYYGGLEFRWWLTPDGKLIELGELPHGDSLPEFFPDIDLENHSYGQLFRMAYDEGYSRLIYSAKQHELYIDLGKDKSIEWALRTLQDKMGNRSIESVIAEEEFVPLVSFYVEEDETLIEAYENKARRKKLLAVLKQIKGRLMNRGQRIAELKTLSIDFSQLGKGWNEHFSFSDEELLTSADKKYDELTDKLKRALHRTKHFREEIQKRSYDERHIEERKWEEIVEKRLKRDWDSYPQIRELLIMQVSDDQDYWAEARGRMMALESKPKGI